MPPCNILFLFLYIYLDESWFYLVGNSNFVAYSVSARSFEDHIFPVKRTTFSPVQRRILEEAFGQSQYAKRARLTDLAQRLQLPKETVRVRMAGKPPRRIVVMFTSAWRDGQQNYCDGWKHYGAIANLCLAPEPHWLNFTFNLQLSIFDFQSEFSICNFQFFNLQFLIFNCQLSISNYRRYGSRTDGSAGGGRSTTWS